MFSFDSREQWLIVAIVTAAVAGAAIKHWRDVRREVPVPVQATDARPTLPR